MSTVMNWLSAARRCACSRSWHRLGAPARVSTSARRFTSISRSSFRHRRVGDRILGREERGAAEHPAQRVAQLAIGLDRGLEDLRSRCAGRRHNRRRMTHSSQDVVAPACFITSCGATTLPSDFDILCPFSSSTKPCVEHDVERRVLAGAAGFEQRGMKPAAMLVGALEVHHGIGPAVLLAANARESRENAPGLPARRRGSSRNRTRRRECRRLSAMARCRACRESMLARARRGFQASAPSLSKASVMRLLTRASSMISTRAVALLAHEYGDRHAPRRAGAKPPSRACSSIMPLMRFCPRRRHPARRLDRRGRRALRSVSPGFATPWS